MNNPRLKIGDVLSYKNDDNTYAFVDLVVNDEEGGNVYEVLDLLGNMGVYRIMWSPSPQVEVT